jgi:hypothetical protein
MSWVECPKCKYIPQDHFDDAGWEKNNPEEVGIADTEKEKRITIRLYLHSTLFPPNCPMCGAYMLSHYWPRETKIQ